MRCEKWFLNRQKTGTKAYMPWSLSFVLTSQSHQHGKTAFEKAGVRVMSIWWSLVNQIRTCGVLQVGLL